MSVCLLRVQTLMEYFFYRVPDPSERAGDCTGYHSSHYPHRSAPAVYLEDHRHHPRSPRVRQVHARGGEEEVGSGESLIEASLEKNRGWGCLSSRLVAMIKVVSVSNEQLMIKADVCR